MITTKLFSDRYGKPTHAEITVSFPLVTPEFLKAYAETKAEISHRNFTVYAEMFYKFASSIAIKYEIIKGQDINDFNSLNSACFDFAENFYNAVVNAHEEFKIYSRALELQSKGI